ncbi:mutator type transposase [Tanacetum coccineum]
MEAVSSPMVAAAKLPVLNPGEFELWKMRIEQYFLMTDYALWEVIVNGDSPPPKRTVDGVEQTYPPTTAEEKLARKNELKARVKMLKYDPRDIMFYHFNIPNKTLDWGLRALASDDDVVNHSQYVKDNKDEEHIIDQLDVNMEGFRFTVQSKDEGYVDPLRLVVNLNEDDLEVIDYDSFESDVGDDDVNNDRRKVLRELKRKGKAAGDGNIVNFFYVGQEFSNREEITEDKVTNDKVAKEKVTKAASVKGMGKKVNTIEDEYKNECPWTVYMAKGENDKWLVRTYKKEHIYLQSRQIKAATASFLSKHVLDLITLNPKIPIKPVQDQMQKQFQVGVSKHKAFRAKSKAAEVMKGDAEVQYKILRYYVVELKKCNPNTTVKLDVYGEEDPESTTRIFRRIYVCFGALKEVFKAGGRELLGLDGAFMKGQYPGQLITAVSVDANNWIYLVAYGIVESESKDSWIWFLNCLGDDLELYRNSKFTFITDKRYGLLPAIKTLFPAAEHRYCVRHIYQNLSLTWRGGIYKELLWKAATATTIVEFNKVMDTLKAQNLKAYEWLKKIPTEHWSRSHFTGRAHCDLLINNICEVFNRQLLDARDSPIVSALEYVREYLMKRIVVVQKVIEKSDGPLTPSVTKVFKKIKVASAKYIVDWNGDELIQVKGPYGDQCVVNLQQRVCSCRKWEVSGLPCKHAVAAIHNMAENGMNVGLPEVWVHPSYRLDTWKQQYSFKVNPISGRNFWELKQWPTTLLPPKIPPQIGRPPKKRKKSAIEIEEMVRGGKLSKRGQTVTCFNCKQKGHNKRGCKNVAATTQSQPQRNKMTKKNANRIVTPTKVMDVPPSPDRVFDFPMAEPEPHPAYYFFATEPIVGLAEAPGEEAGLDLLFGDDTDDDDDEDDWEDDDEWLISPLTPSRATVTLPSTYEVGGRSSTTPGILFPAGQPFPGMTHGTSVPSLVIDDEDGLEEIETRFQQVESRVDTHPSNHMAVHGQELRTKLAEMESRESTLMLYMLWIEERLAVLEKKL